MCHKTCSHCQLHDSSIEILYTKSFGHKMIFGLFLHYKNEFQIQKFQSSNCKINSHVGISIQEGLQYTHMHGKWITQKVIHYLLCTLLLWTLGPIFIAYSFLTFLCSQSSCWLSTGLSSHSNTLHTKKHSSFQQYCCLICRNFNQTPN